MGDSRFDIQPFLRQKEGQHFERKSMWHGPAGKKRPRDRQKVREEAAEYVAAFANADGGVLLLGIEDDGTVTGHDLPAKALASLLSAPANRLDPPQPDGFVVMHEGREVIVFDVPACDVPVQMRGNGFPLRVGDQTIQAKERRIAETKRQGMYESWENRPSPCSLADLDAALLARARRQAGLSSLTNKDYLLKRKLADRHGTRLVLRRAAELLFVRGDPDHPNAGIRVFRVIGTERLTLHRDCSGLLCRQETFHQAIHLLCEGSVVSPALGKAFLHISSLLSKALLHIGPALGKAFLHIGPEFVTALDLPGFTGFHLVPDKPQKNQHAGWQSLVLQPLAQTWQKGRHGMVHGVRTA